MAILVYVRLDIKYIIQYNNAMLQFIATINNIAGNHFQTIIITCGINVYMKPQNHSIPGYNLSYFKLFFEFVFFFYKL